MSGLACVNKDKIDTFVIFFTAISNMLLSLTFFASHAHVSNYQTDTFRDIFYNNLLTIIS